MLRLFWRLARFIRSLGLWLAGLPRAAALALSDRGLERPGSRRLANALLVALPAALLAAVLMPQVTLVTTPSIDAFALRRVGGPIARGDLVTFTLSHPLAGPRPVSVTKYALCLPGDRLDVIETPSLAAPREWDGHYFCNDEPLGVSLPYASNGMKLSHLRWRGVIPAGLAYVGSHHRRGFDSRYFGLVAIKRLTRMERLW